MQELFMVFDVESVGLHGEGFAAAYVVVNRKGETLTERVFSCDPIAATGTDENRDWVAANVPLIDHGYRCPRQVRAEFWDHWMHWKKQGAVLVADCAWPVEAKFLSDAVNDAYGERAWQGPYPLHDLASVLMTIGIDPLEKNERLPGELPEHHPLMDARQSARILVNALKTLER